MIRKRPVILLFTPFYIPGFKGGGPIQTINNLVRGLELEFDFYIFTSDRDLGDVNPYSCVDVDTWTDVGCAKVYYASPKSLSVFNVAKVMTNISYDVLYLNSLFSYRFTLLPILMAYFGVVSRKNVVLAPRGELSTGALAIKSSKKKLFLEFARRLSLYRYCHWQASSEFEAEDIRRVFSKSVGHIVVAPNVVVSDVRADELNVVRESDRYFDGDSKALRVCFLSRVSPMKNLDFALKVLANVKVSIVFDVYGPKEDLEYWALCRNLVAALPENVVFQYCGEVAHSEVLSVIRRYDLFFVPSRGENFGHVFVEAFSAGVPVLLSDRTPWRGLQALKVGWDLDLDDMDRFVEVIEDYSGVGLDVREEMRKNCVSYIRNAVTSADGIKMNIDMFNSVILQQ